MLQNWGNRGDSFQNCGGAFYFPEVGIFYAANASYNPAEGLIQHPKVCLDASLVSPVYNSSNTVQPPALTVQFIVKY